MSVYRPRPIQPRQHAINIALVAGAPGTQTIAPTAIDSAEAFGAATVQVDTVVISPTGIGSAEAFGSGQLDLTLLPSSVASAEAFGTSRLDLTLLPSSAASAEGFGSLSISGPTVNWNISVGSGYTDVSPRQLVRTSGDRLYVFASNCDSYPCDAASQTLRAYRANSTGIPSGFTRQDSADEPAGIAQWAIAIDGSGLIHIVYTRRTANAGNITAFRYVTFDTSTDQWGTPEDIDTGTFSYSSGQGDQSCSLALDTNGKPHAVYLRSDGTRRRMYYRNRVSGSWSSAELVDDQSFGSSDKVWHPNIVFDTAGRRVFAWLIGTFNDTADGTIYVRTRETNDTWNTTVNVSGSDAALTSIDQSTSMVVTPDNRYHITWINASTTPGNKYIRYAYSDNTGSTWSTNHPGSGTQATHNPSLGYAANKLRIFGHGTPDAGNHGENLYYFEGDGGSASWSSWTQFITGTNYDSSVNARWSQYFYFHGGTWDVAYWDDNYPNNLYAGTQIVALEIRPSAIASAEAFGNGRLDLALALSGIASSEEFGTLAMQPGPVTVSPSAISGAETFGDHVVTSGTVIQPSSIITGESFGTSRLDLSVLLLAIGSAETFGSARLDLTLLLSAIISGETFGSAIVQTGGAFILPAGIGSGETFGAALVVPGAVTITPGGIGSAEAFGAAQLDLALLLQALGSAEAFGTLVLIPGAVTIAPSGIVSLETFGVAIVVGGTNEIVPIVLTARSRHGRSLTIAGHGRDLTGD